VIRLPTANTTSRRGLADQMRPGFSAGLDHVYSSGVVFLGYVAWLGPRLGVCAAGVVSAALRAGTALIDYRSPRRQLSQTEPG